MLWEDVEVHEFYLWCDGPAVEVIRKHNFAGAVKVETDTGGTFWVSPVELNEIK